MMLLICNRRLLLPTLAALLLLLSSSTTLAVSLRLGDTADGGGQGEEEANKATATGKEITYADRHRDSFMIHPGTKWCGVGTLAMNYTSLGPAFASDMCCREHDHCASVIPAKETRHHFTSIFHFTISHCECDVKFYKCLLEAQDSQGSSVIDWFFRLVQVPCFELVERQVCLESRRLSMFSGATKCVRRGTGEVAELRQLPYFTDELARMLREQGEIRYS